MRECVEEERDDPGLEAAGLSCQWEEREGLVRKL